MKDQEIANLITAEEIRQKTYIELIASENFVSQDVLTAAGSVLTNKYAEGYPNARYYGGCEIVDKVETLAIKRLCKLFNSKYANVQPHSGTQANLSAYSAILKPGDKLLGLSLSSGGHLSHGYFVSLTGQIYHASSYDVDKKTNLLDYEAIAKIAKQVKPKLIVCGASAYSRIIDWKAFRKIADSVGAYLLADVAHIAGLIITGLHPNPLDANVDIVTSTTHKTLRGPRGGIILTNNPTLAKKIDKAVFPGNQGGPLMHIIAAKAVSFKEAATSEFKTYQKQVVKNAKTLAKYFTDNGVEVLTNGTDNHLLLVNVKNSFNITGQEAVDLLFQAKIIVNKNTIPFDPLPPTVTSGIRIGTPAMTTKGFKEQDFLKLGKIIVDILRANNKEIACKQAQNVASLLNNKRK